SQHSDEPGALGVGWIHNYHSRLIVTPCGEVIIIGGEGSGMRFVDDGDDGLKPLKGYHGTLIADHEEYTYDFYTKSGTRYHYVHTRNENEWYLDRIVDSNGNLITLTYEGDPDEYRVEVVRDSAGRSLHFEYVERDFAFWSGKVLIKVQGPYGTSVSYRYDEFGNLIRATREALRSERYGYLVPPSGELRDRHLLRWMSDELSGAATTYNWDWGVIGIQGQFEVDASYVKSLTQSDSGTTAFIYDHSGLSSRAAELLTQVTDSRGKISSYTLNHYGSPLRIIDGENNVTAMSWAEDDVVMTSRTDGNGVRTDTTYDGEGNLLSETTGAYTKTFSYQPENAFSTPGIKNRVRESTDRNGVVTSFSYDDAGNLLAETVGDWTVGHTCSARGDRLSTTDRNGKTTSFLWDLYGNLAVVIDPLGGRTESTWNGRGLKLSETDALGRTTTYGYDALGRMTST
ncbi:MAG: RHS repeat protein, partial [bacterium]|nr:RHS repeat protein [bacterium]